MKKSKGIQDLAPEHRPPAPRQRVRARATSAPAKQPTLNPGLPDAFWENPATWRELLGPRLSGEFFEAAGQEHPVDHLRHVVREYFYLDSLGA
jgi:hypothetical protein